MELIELDVLTKSFIGIVSIIGTMAVFFLNVRQAAKIKAELLEKFEIALEKKQKHSVTELFRLIHGFRMNYTDIEALVDDDNCSKIIYALKKTPGTVNYKDSQFEYSGVGKSSFFRSIDHWYNKLTIVIFTLAAIASFLVMVFGKGIMSFSGFVLLIVSVVILAYQMRERNYNLMVENLVNPKD